MDVASQRVITTAGGIVGLVKVERAVAAGDLFVLTL
jgi:hypothetical protein